MTMSDISLQCPVAFNNMDDVLFKKMVYLDKTLCTQITDARNFYPGPFSFFTNFYLRRTINQPIFTVIFQRTSVEEREFCMKLPVSVHVWACLCYTTLFSIAT